MNNLLLGIISLAISLTILGVVVYCLLLVPKPGWANQIIQALGILCAVLMVLQMFGLWTGGPMVRIGP